MEELKIILENSSKSEGSKIKRSENFKNISIGIAGILSSILIPFIGYLFTQQAKNQEIKKSYVDLGIQILSQEPKPGTEDLRSWAVDLVNKYSEIKLEGKARQSVIDSVSFSGIETITNKLDRVEKIFPNRVLGFDISHHNKFPSKETLEKYNLKFVFIKATEAANLVDKSLMENVLKAKESGLQYSIYHFFQPNDPVVEQAKNFNTAYKKVRCSLPLMIDVEWADFNNKKNVHYNGLTDSLLNFISLLNAPNKEKIIIYTAPPFAKQYLDNRLSKYQVCLAGVGKNFNPAIGVTNLWNK